MITLLKCPPCTSLCKAISMEVMIHQSEHVNRNLRLFVLSMKINRYLPTNQNGKFEITVV